MSFDTTPQVYRLFFSQACSLNLGMWLKSLIYDAIGVHPYVGMDYRPPLLLNSRMQGEKEGSVIQKKRKVNKIARSRRERAPS